MPSKRNLLKKLKARQWWKAANKNNPEDGKPKSIEKEDSITEKEVARVRDVEDFLHGTPMCRQIALFDRSELEVGKWLGAGSFCEVFEITNICLQSGLERSSHMAESFSNLSESLADATEARRLELADNCTAQDGKPKYALKQLGIATVFLTDNFGCAAIDLMDEASYMLRFDHPNILKIHGMAVDGQDPCDRASYDSFFFIADRLSGTLHDHIQGWKREGKEHRICDIDNIVRKTEYALQIASALEYLHERRIVFRDLKPENIGFLPSKGPPESGRQTVQLFDFGFCRELPQPLKSSKGDDKQLFRMSKVGSQAYMAPEMFSNDGVYNAKADVFSFAVVYYEMLVLLNSLGRRPRLLSVKSFAARGVRPDLTKLGIPFSVQDILKSTWHQSISLRITIRETCSMIETALQELRHVRTLPKKYVRTLPEKFGSDARTHSAKTLTSTKTVMSSEPPDSGSIHMAKRMIEIP